MRRKLFIAAFLLTCCSLLQGAPDRYNAQFDLERGFIIVKAEVNGKAGSYIVDSGAPGLVLNSRRHPGDSSREVDLTGTGGSLKGSIYTPASLQFQGLQIDGLEALCINLGYLEEAVQRQIDGLIGLDLFEGYGIAIDYSMRSIRLIHSAEDIFRHVQHVSLPVEMQGHVPVVLLKAGSKVLRFGIDTGSRSNLIDKKAAQLFPDAQHLRDIQLVGTDQRISLTTEIQISGLSARNLGLGTMSFVITDLGQVSPDQPFDGLLGHAFFQNRSVFINAERTKILVTGASLGRSPELFDALLASQ